MTLHQIYNDLRGHEGKLHAFARVLVDNGIYSNVKNACACLRNGVKDNDTITKIYEEWKPGKLKTKDMATHNDKLKEVFKDLKKKTVKQELTDAVEVLEEALMELTLGIKNQDTNKLNNAKSLLENALYGSN